MFTPAIVDQLTAWQRSNMPDRALIYARTLTREPGGVMRESYTYVRTDACRLSMPLATEGNQDGTLTPGYTWTLARPADAVPLDGTERVVIMHANGGSTLVRVLAEKGHRTYQTVKKSDVTMSGVEPFTVATTSRRGPVPLGWRAVITLAIGEP
jgi:hypothetical protein